MEISTIVYVIIYVSPVVGMIVGNIIGGFFGGVIGGGIIGGVIAGVIGGIVYDDTSGMIILGGALYGVIFVGVIGGFIFDAFFGNKIKERKAKERAWDAKRKARKAMEKSVQSLLDSAFKKIEEGDYNGARHDFREVIGVTPKDALGYVNLGMAYNGLGDYDKAHENYDKASELDPSLGNQILLPLQEAAHRRKADADIRVIGGKLPKDADDQFSPKDAMDYYCRGCEYIYHGKTELAIADFKKAIAINKDFILAYGKLGLLYLGKEDFDQAIIYFREAIKLQPDKDSPKPNLAYAYYARGSIYLQNEDYEKALADLTEAVGLNPKDAYAYFNRGMAYYAKDEVDKAIEDFTQAINCGMDMAIAYGNRAEAHRRVGKLAEAIKDLEDASRLDPNNEDWKKQLNALKFAN
ncbi:hypothetical protein AGMMS49928_25020 [Spirochaetia bacterium]|nr:hypothetical protein AGMMS49928_25020 [Spirochaetia bacterium]